MPKISVVMSVYNGERYIREAINSVLCQSFLDFEFIIINDGSTDSTWEILNSYTDVRVQLVDQEVNCGLTKSLNRGISLAKGEYIARQDADDISTVDRLEKQLNFMEENNDVVAVSCWAHVIDAKGKSIDEYTYPILGNEIKEALLFYNPMIHGASVIRREVLLKAEGYREKFVYAQDYDLWLRLAAVGKLCNLPMYLYGLRLWSGSISVAKQQAQSLYAEMARQDTMLRHNNNKLLSHEQRVLNTYDSKLLKILFISHSSQLSGAESCLLTLLTCLDRTRFIPIVVLPSDGPLKTKIDELGIVNYQSPIEWWVRIQGDLGSEQNIYDRLKLLKEIVDKEKPDIIQTNTSVVWEGAIVAKICGIPHVWHLHEHLQSHFSLTSILPLTLVYQLIGLLSTKVVTVSRLLAAQITPYIDKHKILTIQNGILPLLPVDSNINSLKRELGIAENSVICISLGAIVKEKGFENLLLAALLLREKCPEIYFIIAGSGDAKSVSSIVSKINELGLDENVRYLGYRRDVPYLLEQSDMFVMPSLTEAFPIALLEAMSVGLPVIVTDCGGPSEIILHEVDGYIVPVNDPESLSSAIKLLAADSAARYDLGLAAKQKFDLCYKAERYMKDFELLYTTLFSKINNNDEVINFIDGYIDSYQILSDIKSENYKIALSLAERDKELSIVLDTYSWRVTRPLRWISENLLIK